MLAADDGAKSFTYKQIALLAGILRGWIHGQTKCERVGIMLPASAMFPVTWFGVLWSSRIAVPVNFLLSPEEQGAVVSDAGLDLILSTRRFSRLTQKLPARVVFLEDLPLRRRLWLARFRPLPRRPNVAANDTAVILYTSGTTATPKGVELTHGNLYSNATNAIAAMELDRDHRFLNLLPPFHVFGLTAGVLIPVVLGAPVFTLSRFSPLAVAKIVPTKRITTMLAIPSMYAAILNAKSIQPDTFRTVTLAMSGGEPLPERVRTGFQDRFGVRLQQGYGLTETSPVVAVCSQSAHRDGTVGRPIPEVDVRIVGPDGTALPSGQDGEILVRGPGVMKGYYRRPEETSRVLDADGWFRTGDVGRLDEDGFLSITGRNKEMLIIAGENVFAREIETALEAHEGVMQAAVIGVPDELRGEVPVAFIIPKDGIELSESELRNFAKQSIAGFKVPKRVVIRAELPTGPTGKILKRRLRELL